LKPRSTVESASEADDDDMHSSFFSEEEEHKGTVDGMILKAEGAQQSMESLQAEQWEDFLTMQNNQRDSQPELHEKEKTVCMKMFPKMAERTNLNADELKTYY